MINSENIYILTRLNKAFRADAAHCLVLFGINIYNNIIGGLEL